MLGFAIASLCGSLTKAFRLTNHTLHVTQGNTVQTPGMFRRYRKPIVNAMRSYLSMDDISVYDKLRYYMGWVDIDGTPCVAVEGKALRPTLCLFACKATGGNIKEAIPAAVALEFLHNFSLIHDDIQDCDETRHHRPTMWKVWGIPKALVAGNILRIIADRCLEDLVDKEGIKKGQAIYVMGLLTEAYLEMIEGQYLDLWYEGRPDIKIADYLKMISHKTGALIRCALNLGASIGTCNTETVEAFRSFGKSLGYIFQIRDDMLGVWGDESATGKPVGADVRRKKNSLPVVYAMSHTEGEDNRLLMEIYSQEGLLNDRNVSVVLDLMDGINTREYAQNLAEKYGNRAIEAISGIGLPPKIIQEAEELIEFLLLREH